MSAPDIIEAIKRIAERISQLEKRMEMLEKTLPNAGKTNEPAHSIEQRAEGIKKATSSISIELVKKSYHQANYDVGDSGDRIDFIFRFTNHLPKDVRAFTGVVIFRDLFERDILRIDLTSEKTVQSQKSLEWQGGIEFNQFISDHQRLLSVDQKDLSVGFVVKQVIFSDGSRQSFDLE